VWGSALCSYQRFSDGELEDLKVAAAWLGCKQREDEEEMEVNNSLDNVLAEIIKPIVKDAVQEVMNGHGENNLLRPEELADRLQVPVSWVYEQSRQGNIPTHRLGRYIRFDLNEVLACTKKDHPTT